MFSCFEKLAVAEACHASHFPKWVQLLPQMPTRMVRKTLQNMSKGPKHALNLPYRVFLRTHDTVLALNAPRVLCSVIAQWSGSTHATVEASRIFPFLNSDETNNGLISELPNYVAVVQDVIMNSFSRGESGMAELPRKATSFI